MGAGCPAGASRGRLAQSEQLARLRVQAARQAINFGRGVIERVQTGGIPDGAMRPLNYQVMFEVEDEHWWYAGRRAIVMELIEDALQQSSKERRILDIVCRL